MTNGIMDRGLADRDGACNAVRIPTGRYPLYSRSQEATFGADGTAEIEFEAERDLLITELTMVAGVDAGAIVLADASYCNTKYLENSSVRNWAVCCDSRPFWLVGIRENKSLVFRFTGGTADGTIRVTVAGFQGNGCCG